MENDIFDLVVIGSGPAGFAATMRAVDFKKQVCLIEAGHIGGAGIMNGALTSKTMWELSNDYSIAARVDRGYRAAGLIVNYEEVKKTVLQAAKDKQLKLLSQIETFARRQQGRGSITLKYGWAQFVDKTTVEITNNGHKETVRGRNFIIATGSRPRDLPEIEIDHERVVTSDSIMALRQFPERLVIIGSGIIGCEFATIFSNFGQTEVHLLDRSHRVLPYEDDDVSAFVAHQLEANGVIVHHTASLRCLRKHPTHLEVVLDYLDGHSRVIEADVALVAVGRIPNVENMGLEKIDIQPSERGILHINEYCMIDKNPHKCQIFAAGDITGHAQLYSVAEHQGRNAVQGIFDKKVYVSDYSSMSTLMFFKPLVASVGKNESQLRNANTPYKVAWFSNALVNRSIAMRSTTGFVKVMVSDDDECRILGMRAAGPQASAFIVSIAHLINQGNTLDEVLKIIHPHPSVTEGIQECFRVLKSESIYKPEAFPDLIRLYSWKPNQ